MTRTISVVGVLGLVMACGGASPPPPPPTSTTTPPADGESGSTGSSSGSTTSTGSSGTSSPSGDGAACRSDADCTLTDHGCCSCCPEAVQAITKTALEAQNKKCMTVECAACPKKNVCPKVKQITAYAAKCSSGACTLVSK